MSDNRQKIGVMGEQLAANYLRKTGKKILCTNYRCRYGEIDIIARDQETILFIEVKSRTSNTFGPPAAAVTMHKQQQIIKTALYYLTEKNLSDTAVRLDVIAVLFQREQEPCIEYISNAFEI